MSIKKIVTDNIPILDELVYYAKILGMNTVLKNEDEALKNETKETLKHSDIYIACMEGRASIYMFNYTKEDLFDSGISEDDRNIDRYLSDEDLIPEKIKPKLLDNLTNNFINNYEEYNNYYRTLNGQPEYIAKTIPLDCIQDVRKKDTKGIIKFSKPLHEFNSDQIQILIDSGRLYDILLETNSRLIEWNTKRGLRITSNRMIAYNEWDYIPDEFTEEVERYLLPSNLPLHYYTVSEITTMEYLGVIDYYRTNYPEKKYVNFLGEKKTSPYDARKTVDFGVIFVPRVSVNEIRNKYYERLLVNRDFVINTIHSEAFKLHSTHYNDFIMIYIIVLSMADVMGSTTEFIIRRELFDIRTIEYLLNSYGVTFFSDIPLRYQQKIVKQLNSLIKYKSSPSCMELIASLFGSNDIKIYKYFLIKTRITDDNGIFIFSNPNNIHLYHTANLSTNLSGIYELENNDTTGINRVWRLYENDGSLKSYIKYDNNIWGLYDKDDTLRAEINEDNPIGDWIIDSTDFSETVYSRFTNTEIDDFELKFCKVLFNEHLENYINDEDNYKEYDEITSLDPYWNGDKDPKLVKTNIMEEKFNFIRSKYFSIDIMYDLSELSIQRPYLYGMIFDEEERASTIRVNVDAISLTNSFRLNDLICYLISLSYMIYKVEDKIPSNREELMMLKGFNFEASIEELQKYLYENGIKDVDLSNFSPSGSYVTLEEMIAYYKDNTNLLRHLIDRMNNADNKHVYDIYKNIYDAVMIEEQTNNLFVKSKNENYNKSEENIVLYYEGKDNSDLYSGVYTTPSFKKWHKLDKDNRVIASITCNEKDRKWELKDSSSKVIATLPAEFLEPIGYWDGINIEDYIYTRFTDDIKDGYERFTTYKEFIEARDPILGQSLREIDSIVDESTKLDMISNIILSSIEILESLLYDSDQAEILRKVFSNLNSISLKSLSVYIRHLIEFFKSFTVQLLEIDNVFKIEDELNNKLSPIDDIVAMSNIFGAAETIEIYDYVNQVLSTNTFNDKITILDRVYIERTYEEEGGR